MWPWGGTIFDPRAISCTNLVEVHLVMLNTKYQGSWPRGFPFSLYKPIKKNMWPPGRGLFWSQVYNNKQIGRGLLGDDNY